MDSTITEKQVKRTWIENGCMFVELKNGRIGRECFNDYPAFRGLTKKQLENFKLSFDGVWWDEIDEGLELSGFFWGDHEVTTKAVSTRKVKVGISLDADVLAEFKSKADEAGIPYQSLLNSVIKRYNAGSLNISKV